MQADSARVCDFSETVSAVESDIFAIGIGIAWAVAGN
jgi:hypothetical protein